MKGTVTGPRAMLYNQRPTATRVTATQCNMWGTRLLRSARHLRQPDVDCPCLTFKRLSLWFDRPPGVFMDTTRPTFDAVCTAAEIIAVAFL